MPIVYKLPVSSDKCQCELPIKTDKCRRKSADGFGQMPKASPRAVGDKLKNAIAKRLASTQQNQQQTQENVQKAQEYATAIAALTSQLAFYKAKKQIDKQNMNKMGRVKKKEKTKRIPTISIPSISSTSEKVAPSPISSSVHKSASTVSASLNRAHRSPNCFPPATRQQPVSRLEASSSVNSSNVVKNEQKLDTAIPNSEKSSVSLKESSPMTNYSNLMAFRTGSNYTHATFDEEASAEMFRNETRRVQELLARRHSAGSAIGTAGSGIGGTGRDVTDSLNSTQTTTRCDTAVGNLTISKRNKAPTQSLSTGGESTDSGWQLAGRRKKKLRRK